MENIRNTTHAFDLADVDPDTLGGELMHAPEEDMIDNERNDGNEPRGLFMPDEIRARLNSPLPREALIEMKGANGEPYVKIPAIVLKYLATNIFQDRWNTRTIALEVTEREDFEFRTENGQSHSGRREIVTCHLEITVKGENGHSQIHTAHGVGFSEYTSKDTQFYKAICHKNAVKSAETDALCTALERYGPGLIKSKDSRMIIAYIKNAQRKRHDESRKKKKITPGTAGFSGSPVSSANKKQKAEGYAADAIQVAVTGKTRAIVDSGDRNAIIEDAIPDFDFPIESIVIEGHTSENQAHAVADAAARTSSGDDDDAAFDVEQAFGPSVDRDIEENGQASGLKDQSPEEAEEFEEGADDDLPAAEDILGDAETEDAGDTAREVKQVTPDEGEEPEETATEPDIDAIAREMTGGMPESPVAAPTDADQADSERAPFVFEEFLENLDKGDFASMEDLVSHIELYHDDIAGLAKKQQYEIKRVTRRRMKSFL